MAHEPRPAPQVSIRDPARAGEPLDLLEAEPRPSPFTRRRLLVATAALAVAGLVAGGLELQERRAAAAEERRLGAIVDVVAQPEGSSSSYDPQASVAQLESQVLLLNRGPRELVVLDARVGDYRLTAQEVIVPAGRQVPALLQQSVRCSPEPPPSSSDVERLVLEVRTPTEERTVEVPVAGFSADEGARACGFVPLEEAAGIAVIGASRPGDALVLAVDLLTSSVRPVELMAVEVGPGLRAVLTETDGSRVALPTTLPSGNGPSLIAMSRQLRIEVVDCDAARAGAGSARLALQVREQGGRTATSETLYELSYLLDLLRDVC